MLLKTYFLKIRKTPIKRALLCLLLFQSIFTHAQIILSPDTTVCFNYSGTLQAISANESYMAADDQHDSLRSIGFTFDFYGQSYTELVISGNGYITFDLTQANNYSPWAINAAVPNPGNVPQNAIMAPWHDINTAVGGYISYGMSGIAPNRKFTVTWCSIAMYSCTSDLFTSQVILYEGSNKIEMFIQDKPLCIGWNGGAAIQGLVDASSTNFEIVDDPVLLIPRNWPLPWTATNEGWEFIPNGPNDYLYNQITYIPINTGLNQWSDLFGTILGQGSSLPISISSTSTFIATITGNCIATSTTDTVTINITNPTVTLGPDISLACNTDTIIYPQISGATSPYTYLWSTGSIDSFLLVDSTNVYSITITDSEGCQTIDEILISTFPAPAIILENSLTIPCGSDTLIDPIIYGGTAPYTYLWNTGDTDSMLSIGDGLYYITVTDANGCFGLDTIELIYDAPPEINLGLNYNIACNTTTLINPIVISGTQPYNYMWNNGSNDPTISVGGGSYNLTVTDIYGCTDTDTIIITEESPPIATISGGGSICDDGTTTSVSFNFNGLLPWSLTYTNGSFSSTINNIDSSNYSLITSNGGQYNIVVAEDPNTCQANIIGENINITINPLPEPIIIPGFYEIYPEEEVSLTAGVYSYYWWYDQNDSLISENEILIADTTMTTYVIVEDDQGCIGISDLAIVESIPRVNLFIPNTFTPNGDEHNDLLVTIANHIESFYMIITNRWGEVVYSTNDINKFWDGKFKGKAVEQGAYTYQVNIIGKDKRPFNTSGIVNAIY